MIIPVPRITVHYVHVPLSVHWQALARTSVASVVLMLSTIILLEPASLLAAIVLSGGPLGRPAMWLLAGIALTACVDVIINDMLPPRFTMEWARHRRHLLYLAMALLLTALAAVVAYFGIYSPLLWVFLAAYAVLSAAVAYLDLFSRVRG